jgi:predicted amidohydrolase
VETVRYRGKPGALAISGNSNPAEFGGWEYTAPDIEAGKWYRLTAFYRAEAVEYEPIQVVARLDWANSQGRRAGQPDYAYRTTPEGSWNRVVLEAPAPAQAAAVKLQFFLANAPQGTVWWDDISFEEIPAPPARIVTVVSINLRPRNSKSTEESIRRFIEVIDQTVPGKTDIILLPEGITAIGTGKRYAEAAEPIPGPTTALLGETARRRRTYIVAGIYERDGIAVYNTAVLIDRAGNVAGKYRKVYLPREEYEGGLTPGASYPVFQTDFGRVGLMICWDVQYTDPARALALRGAELILMPIAGGNETLAKARAIENHVYLAASGYDYPNHIISPNGEVIALAPRQGTAAIAAIDLNQRFVDSWLGDMRGRFMKEVRLDVDVERDSVFVNGR